MKDFITRYTDKSHPTDIVAAMYGLYSLPADQCGEAKAKLLKAYKSLNDEIKANGGPYVLGEQFTLADVAIIPFVERATILLAHFRDFTIPTTAEFETFHAWRKSYLQRPSVQISEADRLPRSIAVQPFGKTKRAEYLIEMYSAYANGVGLEVREQLANAPPGVSTVNLEVAKARKAEKAAEAAKVAAAAAAGGDAAATPAK